MSFAELFASKGAAGCGNWVEVLKDHNSKLQWKFADGIDRTGFWNCEVVSVDLTTRKLIEYIPLRALIGAERLREISAMRVEVVMDDNEKEVAAVAHQISVPEDKGYFERKYLGVDGQN